jgi:hypothetical protein
MNVFLNNNKDKTNIFNFSNKAEIYVKGNKLSSTPLHKNILDELITENKNNYYSWNLFNNSRSYKTKDLASANLKFLSLDKSSRSFVNSKLNETNLDFNVLDNSNLIRKDIFNLSNNLSHIHNSSVNYWSSDSIIKKNTKTNLSASTSVNAIHANNPLSQTSSFDRLPVDSQGEVAPMLKSKEESAPDFIFNTYWSSHYKNASLLNNYNSLVSNFFNLRKSMMPSIVEYSEYDFRNWQSLESLEDSIWESFYPSFLGEEYFSSKDDLFHNNYNNLQDLYNQKSRLSKFKYKPEHVVSPVVSNYIE